MSKDSRESSDGASHPYEGQGLQRKAPVLEIHDANARQLLVALPGDKFRYSIEQLLAALRELLRLAFEEREQDDRKEVWERRTRLIQWANQRKIFGTMNEIAAKIVSCHIRWVFPMAEEFVSSPSDANILARTIGHRTLLDVVWKFDPMKDGDFNDFARGKVRERLANYVGSEAPALMKEHHQPFATVTLGVWAYDRAQSRIHPKGDDDPRRVARFTDWAKAAGLPGKTRDELLMSATIRFTTWVRALAGSPEYQFPERPERRAELIQAGVAQLSDLLRRFDPEEHGRSFEEFAHAEIADTLATEYQFLRRDIERRVRTRSRRQSPQSPGGQWTPATSPSDEEPPVADSQDSDTPSSSPLPSASTVAAVAIDSPGNGNPRSAGDILFLPEEDPRPSTPETPDPPAEGPAEDTPSGTDPETPADPEAERKERFSLWARAQFGPEAQTHDHETLVGAICGKFDPVTRSHTIKVVKDVERANRGRKITVSRDHLIAVARTALKQTVIQYDPETDGDFVANAKKQMEQAVRVELRPQIMRVL